MSIFGSMKTAVSGMNAQANMLGTVADNIANSATTGYKSASTAFSSLVLPSSAGSYTSGGVTTAVRYSVSNQGDLSYTTSGTDLAIQGDGFFVVQNSAGTPYLTRAGDFTADADGNLVNSAGFTLMGYPYTSGTPSVVVNGFGGLVPVNVSAYSLSSSPTTTGSFAGNLDSSADEVTGDTPLDNASDSTYTSKTSLAAYDSLGNSNLYDFYYTKGDTDADGNTTWQVVAYKQADAYTGGSTSFPYTDPTTGDPEDPVLSGSVTFDSSGNFVSSTDDNSSATTGAMTLTDGTQSISMDMSSFTQLSTSFSATGTVDGSAPSAMSGVKIGTDGTVYASYEDGSSKALYRVPLATVASPDNLTLESGNVYSQSATSGVVITGFPGEGTFGSIASGALEASNVDLASQLTDMIQAQHSYTANSKVFQTGSTLMDVLVQLVR